jgi:hypothetical protein
VTTRFSPDGHWYWDGQRWLTTLSPDARWRWNGYRWVPYRVPLTFGFKLVDGFAGALWLGLISAACVVADRWLSSGPAVAGASLIALGVGLVLAVGLVGGVLVRARSPWWEAPALALLGAGWLAFSFYMVLIVFDPTGCDAPPGGDCDTGYSVGAMLVAAVSAIPLVAGFAAGKVVAWLALRILHRVRR